MTRVLQSGSRVEMYFFLHQQSQSSHSGAPCNPELGNLLHETKASLERPVRVAVDISKGGGRE